jgi:hypothetical protein
MDTNLVTAAAAARPQALSNTLDHLRYNSPVARIDFPNTARVSQGHSFVSRFDSYSGCAVRDSHSLIEINNSSLLLLPPQKKMVQVVCLGESLRARIILSKALIAGHQIRTTKNTASSTAPPSPQPLYSPRSSGSRLWRTSSRLATTARNSAGSLSWAGYGRPEGSSCASFRCCTPPPAHSPYPPSSSSSSPRCGSTPSFTSSWPASCTSSSRTDVSGASARGASRCCS